jgi:hypothetical protein
MACVSETWFARIVAIATVAGFVEILANSGEFRDAMSPRAPLDLEDFAVIAPTP